MRFMIRRTSTGDDIPPCDKAYRADHVSIDTCTVADPQELGLRAGRHDWYKRGVNHRVENGHIKRDFNQQGWFIDIDNLCALLEFIKRYGKLVVQPFFQNESIILIEIYDDYRE